MKFKVGDIITYPDYWIGVLVNLKDSNNCTEIVMLKRLNKGTYTGKREIFKLHPNNLTKPIKKIKCAYYAEFALILYG